MTEITVYKLDDRGRERWRYTGTLLDSGADYMQIEARFNRPDSDQGYVVFRHNDRFIEWFYSSRWFNIFEIHDGSDDHLKGWYCNITRPARLLPVAIYADDLALDLWVASDGEMRVVDEDEFAALDLDPPTRSAARQALDQLQSLVRDRVSPFDKVSEAV